MPVLPGLHTYKKWREWEIEIDLHANCGIGREKRQVQNKKLYDLDRPGCFMSECCTRLYIWLQWETQRVAVAVDSSRLDKIGENGLVCVIEVRNITAYVRSLLLTSTIRQSHRTLQSVHQNDKQGYGWMPDQSRFVCVSPKCAQINTKICPM